MDTKTKTMTEQAKAAQAAGADVAQIWMNLAGETSSQMDRLMRAQLGHATQVAREATEFWSSVSEATLKTAEQSRKQGFDYARDMMASAK